MDDRPYFHDIAEEEWEALKASGETWEEMDRRYQAPDWCNAKDEVIGALGCWSLVSTRSIRQESDCANCDECKSFNDQTALDNPPE